MSQRICLACVGLACIALIAGCSKEESTFVRDPVTRVTGTLLIDGQPEEMVAIRLNRVGDVDENAGTSQVLTPSAFTDKEGKFSIGTYDKGPQGDGAAPGDYKLTFQWGQINLLGGRYEGDKFNGKYRNPDDSEWSITVVKDPVDVGTIDLSMDDVPEVKSPLQGLGGDSDSK